MAGLETGLGNRSYSRLYPARPSSARCIDQLVDAGAILVGKTKTTQFAEGEMPIQWYGFSSQIPAQSSLSYHPKDGNHINDQENVGLELGPSDSVYHTAFQTVTDILHQR